MSTESVSCDVSSDMKVVKDSATDLFSLQTAAPASSVSSVSDVSCSEKGTYATLPSETPVAHHIQSGTAISGSSISTAAPTHLPSFAAPSVMFSPSPAYSVQSTPHLVVPPSEVPVAQSDQHLLLPTSTLMLPHQPTSLSEQLTPVPGELPQEFSAPPVMVCHSLGPKRPENPILIPVFSRGHTTLSTVVSQEQQHAELAVNAMPCIATATSLSNDVTGSGTSLDSDVAFLQIPCSMTGNDEIVTSETAAPLTVCHSLGPKRPANPILIPMPAKFPRGLSTRYPVVSREPQRRRRPELAVVTDITRAGVGSVSEFTVSWVSVPLQTRQVQSGLTTADYSLTTPAASLPPEAMTFAPPPSSQVQVTPRLMAAPSHSVPVADGAPQTEQMLFACPNCDYKIDSEIAVKQHCVNSHRAFWQGEGKPLQNMSKAQFEFETRLRKQQFSTRQEMPSCLTATQSCDAQSDLLLPQGSAVLRSRPRMLQTPICEQLTQFPPGALPGQLPRGLSAPPAMVCNNLGPEMSVNPTPVPSPGDIPRGFPAPSGMVYREPCSQPLTRSALSTDVTNVHIVPAASGLQVPVPMQTQQLQSGLVHRPGMLHTPLCEQLTPFSRAAPWQHPREFSVPPVMACHNPGPQMPMTPMPVPPPGDFPRGLPAPSGIVCREPCPQTVTSTVLSTDVSDDRIVRDASDPQVPVPLQTQQLQSGFALRPRTMQTPLREQLTPFSCAAPWQRPREFSVPPVMACRNPGPQMSMNPMPVPPPGDFPRGLHAPSHTVCRESCPQTVTNTVLSTDVSDDRIVRDASGPLVLVPLQTQQLQSGFALRPRTMQTPLREQLTPFSRAPWQHPREFS